MYIYNTHTHTHTHLHPSIRQHTYTHTHTNTRTPARLREPRRHTSAYVGIRRHTSAYVSIRQHTSAHVSTPARLKAARRPYPPLDLSTFRNRPFLNFPPFPQRPHHLHLHRPHVLHRSPLPDTLSTRPSAYVSIRQHTSAYVSIRQHTSAYVSIRQHTSAYVTPARQRVREAFASSRLARLPAAAASCPASSSLAPSGSPPAYVSIRQHTSAFVSIRQHTSAYVSIRQHCPASAALAPCGWVACSSRVSICIFVPVKQVN
jgi:isocitrate/isopropylmalate dehydrogenase